MHAHEHEYLHASVHEPSSEPPSPRNLIQMYAQELQTVSNARLLVEVGPRLTNVGVEM